MKFLFLLTASSVIGLTGGRSPKFAPQAGTQLEMNDDGGRVVTYVSEAEYQRMTEDERKRLNAQVGAKMTVGEWGKSTAKPRDLSTKEINTAVANAH